MPGGVIRPIQPGGEIGDLSVRDLQQMADTAGELGRLTVGPGLELDRTAGRLRISLAGPPPGPVERQITVAVVREPDQAELCLWVRGVRYRNLPPIPSEPNCEGPDAGCTYDWAGDDFRAYPDFGAELGDYSPYVWTEPGPPRLETPYLRARWETVWIVEIPLVVYRYVVVVGIPGDAANYVLVRDVQLNRVDGSWDGTFVLSGEPWPAACHPQSRAGDYAGLLWDEAQPIDDSLPVLPAQRAWGGWWVSQYIRWELSAVDPGLTFNDCVPRFAAAAYTRNVSGRFGGLEGRKLP